MQELRMYETTFIITPEIEQAEFEQVSTKFSDMITNQGGEIVNREIWGFRKLAYPINKKLSGYYVFIEFQGNPEFVEKLEREFQYDDRIIRYLTVKLDKFAVAYNVRRRERLGSQSAQPTQ